MAANPDKADFKELIRYIATYLGQCLTSRQLEIRPILYHTIVDGMTHKERVIGVEEPVHQILDYIAVGGLQELFDAKIGLFQCASLPGKGQSYGKKYVERWVKEKNTVYFVKGDIKKCFPSIPIDRLKQLLQRDIKNDTLLWLTFQLLDMFQGGLSIGSYLSQYLCNYYLSYAYHYAESELFKIRKTKRNGDTRVRLITHMLFYMDDFLLTGSSKKDLRKAMQMLSRYIETFLGIEVKSNWKISKLSDTEPIDMMGFVFRRERTTIRARIFLKTRRKFVKAQKLISRKGSVPLLLAYQCVSGYGWYKNTSSHAVRKKCKITKITNHCKRIISKRGEV